MENWPINRDFVRAIPEEEKRAAIYGVHVNHQDPSPTGTGCSQGSAGREHVLCSLALAAAFPEDLPPNIKLSDMPNVTKLYEIVNTVMSRTNSYHKARRVLARVLGAHKKSLPVNSDEFMQALKNEPTVDFLKKAKDLMLLVAAWEVTPYISKLKTLGPIYRKGVWICKGPGVYVLPS